MNTKTYGALLLIAALTLLTPMTAVAQQDRYYSDEELQWLLEGAVEDNVCGGQCTGISHGWAQGAKKCADMTAEETEALKTAACDKADKPTARSNANDNCLDRDNTGNCLCANGIFSAGTPGTPADGSSGKCEVTCTLIYLGTCSTFAATAATSAGN